MFLVFFDKASCLTGKTKIEKFPWVAFQMLRLSGLAAQQCPRPTGHTSHCYVYCSLYISSLVRFFKVVFSYVNLGCNKIVLYCTLCACFSWPMMLCLQAKMPREGTWVISYIKISLSPPHLPIPFRAICNWSWRNISKKF